MIRNGLIFLFLPLIAVLWGCSSEDPGEQLSEEQKSLIRQAHVKKFKADLVLEMGRKRIHYTAGTAGEKLPFLLTNKGLTQVPLDGWYMADKDNITLYYALCEKGKSGEVKKTEWKVSGVKKDSKDRGQRMPVVLNPNTSLVLNVPMDFLKKIRMKGKPIRYVAVYAEVSVKSIRNLRSPVYELEIRPVIQQM